MNSNEIIKAALLGTDRYCPQPHVAIGATGGKIMAAATDKEDKFLKLAVTTLLYEEAGQKPNKIDGTFSRCQVEPLTSINKNLDSNIRSCLSTKDEVLFQYFLHLAKERNQVVTSDLVPAILNKALEHKGNARAWAAVCGQTGNWLCSLNPDWNALFHTQEDKNVWETGSIELRKNHLTTIRTTAPTKALALLEGTIDKESAANRSILVEVLDNNLSLQDEPFLEKLRNDKSQKVKDIATGLLQKLQGSVINKRYLDYLLQVINVKEERYMLISKRKVLTIKEDLLPGEDIFSTGIDKISSNKDMPDHIYVLGQLLRFIDPTTLSTRLGTTEEELISLLLQHKTAEKLHPYLAVAAGRFRNRTWALHMLQKKETRHLVLLDALPENERLNYYELFVDTHIQAILQYTMDEKYTIMPHALGKRIIDHYSKNPYAAATALYRRLALYLPNQLLPHLKQYADSVSIEYHDKYFKTQAMEMMRVIEMKNNVN